MDILLLKILRDRKQYDLLVPSLPREALENKTLRIVDSFGRWFKETNADRIESMEDFKTYFFNFCYRESKTQNAVYSRILNNCGGEVEPKLIDSISNKLLELGFATSLANLNAQYCRGDEIDILEEVKTLHKNVTEKIAQEEEDFHITDKIEDVIHEDRDTTGLQFSLGVLRHSIRPLREGDFVIAAGRPDTGKTSFLTSNLLSFNDGLPHERPVLWFNNEGKGNRILKRIYQSVLGDTTEDLLVRDRQGTLHNDFTSACGGRSPFLVVDCHNWDTTKVERAIQRYNPGLVIFDMIDNIQLASAGAKRNDLILEEMYQWARELGVIYGFPVIATSQVSAEADLEPSTRVYPEMHMLKDSKTGKQGAADLIIMIGRNADDKHEDRRYISTPKNKLTTTGTVIKRPVKFDKLRGRYEDI